MPTRIGTYDLANESIEALENGGMLLVTGEQGNPMTIGWGVIGTIWGRPVFQVLVRPSRYSFSLLEKLGEFTVCVPTEGQKKTLAVCGSKSGRDLDKIDACNLSLGSSEHVDVPYIAECGAHYECRVIHVNDVVNATLETDLITRMYPNGDFHRVYFGEILGVYRH